MSSYDVVISSGHGKIIRGAKGILDEVDEARRVVNRVAQNFKISGGSIGIFHDDVSKTQNSNLSTIVKAHNAYGRKLDVSVHFNANKSTTSPMGCEVLYFDAPNKAAAAKLSAAIAKAGGFKDRGAKQRTDLYFLRNTSRPALLIEVCFVDSTADANLYKTKFEAICKAISDTLISLVGGKSVTNTSTSTSSTTTSTTTNNTKPKYYRVQTGTYATKQAADSAASRIKALKIAGVVHVNVSGARYYLTTGQYATKQAADNAMNSIKTNKIASVVSVIEDK